MRHLIETHFGIVLLLSCVAGLLLPELAHVPDYSASVALAMLTYASCFKLRDGGFDEIRWRRIAVFYAGRYIVLPVLLWLIAHHLFPAHATGIFLLALLPTAVSSPAFAHMFGGRVPPAFAIVMVSTCLAPFLIPLQFSWLGDMTVAPSPWPLFKTLAFCVFTPMLLYVFTRTHKQWGNLMYANVKLISIVLVAFVIALVIAKQREVILADLPALAAPLAVCIGCYAVFLTAGWLLSRGASRQARISMATCSGFNNVALGVSVALLHFPPSVILFVAVSEIGWAFLPTLLRAFLRVV